MHVRSNRNSLLLAYRGNPAKFSDSDTTAPIVRHATAFSTSRPAAYPVSLTARSPVPGIVKVDGPRHARCLPDEVKHRLQTCRERRVNGDQHIR